MEDNEDARINTEMQIDTVNYDAQERREGEPKDKLNEIQEQSKEESIDDDELYTLAEDRIRAECWHRGNFVKEFDINPNRKRCVSRRKLARISKIV